MSDDEFSGTNLPDDASVRVSEDRLHLVVGDRKITLKVFVENEEETLLDPMRDSKEPDVRHSDDLVHWDVENDDGLHVSILPEVLEDDD